MTNDIPIDLFALAAIAEAIPPEDFVNARFDMPSATAASDVLFLLSTPRCGSTLLADLVRRAEWCLPHEYFQPYEYLPVLASRWGCIDHGLLDKKAYLKRLFTARTYSSGWLGINLHGGHLPVFTKFADDWPPVKSHYIHIRRRDIIAQGVSYAIALQTGQWSSHFQRKTDATYSFEDVMSRIQKIQEQEQMISAYLKSKRAPCETIYFEDLTAEPTATLDRILPQGFSGDSLSASDLQPQAGANNLEWVQRFKDDYRRRRGSEFGSK